MAAGAVLRDQTAHVTHRLDGWIIFALGVGGAKFPRPCAGRDRHQKQSNEQHCGPPNAGAAVHWQLRPPVMVSVRGKKGSRKLTRRPPRPASRSQERSPYRLNLIKNRSRK